MERHKAIVASAGMAGIVVLGALGFAATSALGADGSDNVGRLDPAPAVVTVVIDPTTGAITTPAATASPVDGRSTTGGQGRDHEEREHEEDEDDD